MKVPLPKTLKKYGLSEKDWIALYDAQEGKCAICGRVPTTGRLCIDHQHGIKGYKKLPDDIKRTYIRGLLCWTCNRLIVGRGVTIERLENALRYMKKFSTSLEVDKSSQSVPKAGLP